MSKKQKKTNESKKVYRQRIIIIAAIIICGFCVGFGGTELVQAIANKTKNSEIRIGFYDLENSYEKSLKDYISANADVKIKFETINPAVFDAEKVEKKYDVIFGWDGNVLSKLSEKAEKINKKCYSQQPSSFSRNVEKKLAVAVDHYEIAYNIEKITQSKVEYPTSFDELERFLSDMSAYVFCPFLLAGGDDKVLLAFISCFIEGKAGSDGYKAFLEEAAKHPNCESLLDFEIPCANKQTITLGAILADLKTWPEKGYTHPSWHSATDVDISVFSETDQVSVIFTSLSNHRKLPYDTSSKYEACRFPIVRDGVDHGLIAPTISCVKFRNSSAINTLLENMVSPEGQERISYTTMLGPSSSQGQSYDRQADDVRFWAAACKDGPLPDLYNAIFQLDAEAGAQFANAVRDYLRS